ncbi:MAG: division/cell wall cluster transcriptional repressor MraZ [Gammaproteobacteria bacterium]|nr:division/cell wall cluster transcriptional repressor MraZ [Gammaproteobacteria bacterium]
MFRGFCTVSIDVKGRIGVPARYRELLAADASPTLVVTVNPWDRCLWLYPLSQWETIDAKLLALPDGDQASRRAKQIIRGQAIDCECDRQGRILIPPELRRFAAIEQRAALLGQGNKLELWDATTWTRQRDSWLQALEAGAAPNSTVLAALSL